VAASRLAAALGWFGEQPLTALPRDVWPHAPLTTRPRANAAVSRNSRWPHSAVQLRIASGRALSPTSDTAVSVHLHRQKLWILRSGVEGPIGRKDRHLRIFSPPAVLLGSFYYAWNVETMPSGPPLPVPMPTPAGTTSD
jgi:hypothetical protein